MKRNLVTYVCFKWPWAWLSICFYFYLKHNSSVFFLIVKKALKNRILISGFRDHFTLQWVTKILLIRHCLTSQIPGLKYFSKKYFKKSERIHAETSASFFLDGFARVTSFKMWSIYFKYANLPLNVVHTMKFASSAVLSDERSLIKPSNILESSRGDKTLRAFDHVIVLLH